MDAMRHTKVNQRFLQSGNDPHVELGLYLETLHKGVLIIRFTCCRRRPATTISSASLARASSANSLATSTARSMAAGCVLADKLAAHQRTIC